MRRRNRGGRHIIAMTTLILFCLISTHLFAQVESVDLQTDLGDLTVGDNWIYGDLDSGSAVAKETGKPLFVVFR